jgi:hypothetical protein
MSSTAEEMLALPTPKDLQALKLKLILTLTTCSLKAAPHVLSAPLQLTALNLWTNCNSATVPLVALQCLQRSDLSEWPGNSARAGVGTGCLTRLDLSSNSGLNDAWQHLLPLPVHPCSAELP